MRTRATIVMMSSNIHPLYIITIFVGPTYMEEEAASLRMCQGCGNSSIMMGAAMVSTNGRGWDLWPPVFL